MNQNWFTFSSQDFWMNLNWFTLEHIRICMRIRFVYPPLWAGTCFASIAFGYPQRIFGVNPKPPRPRKCYNFLKSVHLPLTGWWTLCYPEFAENLCTAPLQLNTQHNRYFTLPVGRTPWSRQTITHDWGEGIMILLLPHASDGVMAFGLESVRSLQGQWTVAASGLPVMFPCLGASGKLDIFLQHLFWCTRFLLLFT